MQAPPTRRRRGRLAWITATLTAGVATVVSGAAFAVRASHRRASATRCCRARPRRSRRASRRRRSRRGPTSSSSPTPRAAWAARSPTSARMPPRSWLRCSPRSPTRSSAVGEYKDVGDVFVYRLNQAITASTAAAEAGSTCGSAARRRRRSRGAALRARGARRPSGHRLPHRLVTHRRLVRRRTRARPAERRYRGLRDGGAPARRVRVIAISTGANQLDATGQATRITAATGGVFLPGASERRRRTRSSRACRTCRRR